MRNNLVAIRVFEKKHALGTTYDVVASELSTSEWDNRCNAPSFVLFINEDLEKIEDVIMGNIPSNSKMHLVALVVKGSQVDSVVEMTQKFMKVSQLLRIAGYAKRNQDTTKLFDGENRLESLDVYTVNPKDVSSFGTKVIRFSTKTVNLK